MKSKLMKKLKDLENVELRSSYKEKIKVLKALANTSKIYDNKNLSETIKNLTKAETEAEDMILTSIKRKSSIIKKHIKEENDNLASLTKMFHEVLEKKKLHS